MFLSIKGRRLNGRKKIKSMLARIRACPREARAQSRELPSEGGIEIDPPSASLKQAKRRKQLDDWQSKHPGSRRKSAQHLSAPGTTPKTAGKEAKPTKKPATGRKTGSKKTASTNSSAEISTAKKSTARKATFKRSARKAATPSRRKAA